MCCDNGDTNLAYISGICLQSTLNMAVEENGLNEIDLMSYYNSKHLEKFKERAMEMQKKFVKMIEDNGVIIDSYSKVEDFIRRN